VSTAEELLREPDVDARRELAHRAAREEWISVYRPAARGARVDACTRSVNSHPAAAAILPRDTCQDPTASTPVDLTRLRNACSRRSVHHRQLADGI